MFALTRMIPSFFLPSLVDAKSTLSLCLLPELKVGDWDITPLRTRRVRVPKINL